MLCVLIRIASWRRFKWVHSTYNDCVENWKQIPKLSFFAFWPGAMINTLFSMVPKMFEPLKSDCGSKCVRVSKAVLSALIPELVKMYNSNISIVDICKVSGCFEEVKLITWHITYCSVFLLLFFLLLLFCFCFFFLFFVCFLFFSLKTYWDCCQAITKYWPFELKTQKWWAQQNNMADSEDSHQLADLQYNLNLP